jgi:hypothetical protein
LKARRQESPGEIEVARLPVKLAVLIEQRRQEVNIGDRRLSYCNLHVL